MATTSKKTYEGSQTEKALRQKEQRSRFFIENSADIVAPRWQWSAMGASEHFVQFCETDEFLIHSVSAYIGDGLRLGDACIVLATESHRESLEERLKGDGLEVAATHLRGLYASIDAAATLSKFMVEGSPEPGRFAEVVGSMIARAAKGQRRVRIFGELVALLWADGNRAAAIRLEELWNDLGKVHAFSLFCAYPMHGFGGEAHEVEFTEICQQHARVIPAESYSALASPDERLRAITLLQQKAKSLEGEKAERKRAEEALLHLAAIVESSDDAILGKNLEGIITSWNAAAERMYGYSAGEIVGQPVTLLFAPDQQDEFTQIMARIRRGERVDHYETVRVRKDGTRLSVSVTISPIKNSTGTISGASSIARDISERKELDKRKDEFISMASHELKTPVTSLKGFLSLLQRSLARHGDGKELHYLARMDAQVDKLTKLINDLLDVSRMQTGQLVYREERFDLDALVQEIVETIQGTTQTHHLLLEGQIQAEVFGDQDRIGQVLINLLNNAIKYSPQADRVQVRVAVEQNKALVSVQDFGIGIAKEHQYKIFERFYQVTDSEEKTYPGLGIGLYISCEIVKRHGGQMWVESKKGEGATFHYTLPLFQEEKR